MRRDMDIVRELLMLEANSNVRETNAYALDKDRALIAYHVRIMTQAGLITSYVKPDDDYEPSACYIFSLTWQGNDLLDSIRSPKVWSAVKEKLTETVGSTSLSILTELISAIARQQLGI